ncbi:hypothetical protein QYF61_011062 [Mycteria americana]|uniref:Zinc finger C3HC4 RING-type domain-containing protein n=1 Tax=Mycteria americana TaxID=33587 RepID=A0AAN7N1M4_MYCAM|nr:hypothetical protein QYF61_011062 [Mycteria americana]
MASGTAEAQEQSSCATTASTSQGQRARWWEAAAGGPCPICLGEVNNAADTNTCCHLFCFVCIWQWA